MGPLIWAGIGALLGCLHVSIHAWATSGRYPGGLLGAISVGIAGAVIGGVTVSFILARDLSGVDVVRPIVAFLGAAWILVFTQQVAGFLRVVRSERRTSSRP